MKLFTKLLLITILLFALIRLFGFIDLLGKESLQADFDAFYTAGESVRVGLSPYKNNLTSYPPISDGTAEYKHSRFLYPPLAAKFFQFFTLFPYPVAKYIWMLFSLSLIGFSVFLTIRILSLKLSLEEWLIIGIIVALFHPLLTLLEKGQVDALTLILVISAIGMMVTSQKSKHDVLAGILWVIATLFKPHIVFIMPFLLIQKKWKVLTGYLIGGLLIIFLTIIVYGSVPFLNYLRDELPRIVKYGAEGPTEMKLPNDILAIYQKGVPEGFNMKNGVMYKNTLLVFAENATLVKPIVQLLKKVEIEMAKSAISVILFVGFAIIFLIYQIYNRHLFSQISIVQKFMYWLSVLVVILLSGPLTWTMNVVWLIPLIIVILYNFHLLKQGDYYNWRGFWLYLCTLGFLIVAMPDCLAFPLLSPNMVLCKVINSKYIIGEIMILISLLFLMRIPTNFIKQRDDMSGVKPNI